MSVSRFLWPTTIIVALALSGSSCAGAASDASGAGATFPQPLYETWSKAFGLRTGLGVTYAGTGSGDGVKQAGAGAVDFGGSDMPVQIGDLQRQDLLQFPTVVGGIVPIVNIDGVDPGGIVVDGPTLAAIFSGSVTVWDDPAIARTNPGLALPHLAIVVVHRADASGTTFVMTGYLSKVGQDWASRMGAGTTVSWPVGIEAKGSEGMVQAVTGRQGAIGYVEYSYAKRSGLTYLNLVNAEGRVVQPTPASVAAALTAVDWSKFLTATDKSLTNQPGGASWPITTATFVLVKRYGDRSEARATVLRLFDWAFAKGASIAQDLDYVPLPDEAVRAIRATWSVVPEAKSLEVHP